MNNTAQVTPSSGGGRRKPLPIERMRSVILRALSGGAAWTGRTTLRWNVGGDCEAPVTRELHSRPSPAQDFWMHPKVRKHLRDHGIQNHDGAQLVGAIMGVGLSSRTITVSRDMPTPFVLTMEVRCRKCSRCLRRRRRMWAQRATLETRASVRTWFGTLTLRPEEHTKVLYAARQRMTRQGIDYERLQPGEQFSLMHFEISKMLTKYLKRVRKNAGGAPLRFLMVAEAHESGLPHYHMLIHEKDPLRPVRKTVLDDAYHAGFCKWRLVPALDPRAASYACKYLAKDNRARVRASLSYGRMSP